VFGVAGTSGPVADAVSKRVEITLSWLLVDTLAEALGPCVQDDVALLDAGLLGAAVDVAGRC
jgi:hypothetical protein